VAAADVLLRVHCRANLQDNDGQTALIHATVHGHAPMAIKLAQSKVDLDVQDVDGMTALMHAAQRGHASVVDALLLEQADLFTRDVRGRTALICAAAGGHVAICNALVQACISQMGGARSKKNGGRMVVTPPHGLSAADGTSGVPSSIQQRVDMALSKVGVVASAVAMGSHTESPSSMQDIQKIVEASKQEGFATADMESAQRSLETLSRGIRVLPQVRNYVSITDKNGCTAADRASDAGHRELAHLLRRLMKSEKELLMENMLQQGMTGKQL